MKSIQSLLKVSVLLSFFLLIVPFVNAQQDVANDDITGSVSCDFISELNGTVTFQYEVSLTNNSSSNAKLKYTVYFKSGSTILKSYAYSDILIPG